MDRETAEYVGKISKDILGKGSVPAQTEIRPRTQGGDFDDFVVDHLLSSGNWAQLAHLLLTEMCCEPIQLMVTRWKDHESDDDRWILRQESIDLAESYSKHVCDALFGIVPDSERIIDYNWEAEIRDALGDDCRCQIVLGQTKAHGREVTVWGFAQEHRARLAHQFLVHRFGEMHLGMHFNLQELSRLDDRFERAGWAVTACEH